MYEQVKPQARHERNTPLMIALAICALALVLVVGAFLWGVRYHLRYRAFISDLSNSVTYAYEHQSLKAQVGGETLRVTGENIYRLYNYILAGGMGRVTRRLPETQAAIALDYGDGGTLLLWDVASEGYEPMRERSLLLCYTDAQGGKYIYATDALTLETVAVSYLSANDNPPWEE